MTYRPYTEEEAALLKHYVDLTDNGRRDITIPPDDYDRVRELLTRMPVVIDGERVNVHMVFTNPRLWPREHFRLKGAYAFCAQGDGT